jgi:hypothetical protein
MVNLNLNRTPNLVLSLAQILTVNRAELRVQILNRLWNVYTSFNLSLRGFASFLPTRWRYWDILAVNNYSTPFRKAYVSKLASEVESLSVNSSTATISLMLQLAVANCSNILILAVLLLSTLENVTNFTFFLPSLFKTHFECNVLWNWLLHRHAVFL